MPAGAISTPILIQAAKPTYDGFAIRPYCVLPELAAPSRFEPDLIQFEKGD